MNKKYYEILGVSQNATKEEIRAKYYELVKKYHPDVNSAENSKEIIQEINAAYDVLRNENKRKEYDALLNQTYTSNEQKRKEDPFNYEKEIKDELLKVEKYHYYYNEKDNLKKEVNDLMNRFRIMKSKMASGVDNVIKLKEMKEVSTKYIILLNKYKKLYTTMKKLNITEEIPLKYQVNIENLEYAYDEVTNYRDDHIIEFFDTFTDSTKRRTIGGLLIHDNVALSGICLLNATAATLSIINKHYVNPSIPSTIILISINAVSLKNRYEKYKANYNKGKNIINSDNDTKEEYKEYCLRRNIKNKSI